MTSAWSVLAVLVAIGGFIFFANMIAHDQLGIGIPEAVGITSGIPQAELSAPSIDTLPTDSSDAGISRARAEKTRLDADYTLNLRRITALNGSGSFRNRIVEAVGSSYSVYVFCTYVSSDKETKEVKYYKTFEWVIRARDGAITQFEKGAPDGAVNIKMSVDAGTAEDLLSGEFVHTDLLDGMQKGSIKLQPAIQGDNVVKFFSVLGSRD